MNTLQKSLSVTQAPAVISDDKKLQKLMNMQTSLKKAQSVQNRDESEVTKELEAIKNAQRKILRKRDSVSEKRGGGQELKKRKTLVKKSSSFDVTDTEETPKTDK